MTVVDEEMRWQGRVLDGDARRGDGEVLAVIRSARPADVDAQMSRFVRNL